MQVGVTWPCSLVGGTPFVEFGSGGANRHQMRAKWWNRAMRSFDRDEGQSLHLRLWRGIGFEDVSSVECGAPVET